MSLLKNKINRDDFHCIVCLKRSGFIIGVYLSNQLNLPLFTASEIKSIPDTFINILILDDKICTGKSIQKIKNRLKTKNITTACLFIERDIYTDLFITKLNGIYKMWYEI